MTNEKLSYRNWSILNGLFAIIFGLIAIAYTDLTITWLAIIFGITLIPGGIALIVSAYKNMGTKKFWRQNLILGILSIILAFTILLYPKHSIAALLFVFVGLWAVFTGVIFIFIWIYSRKSENWKAGPVTLIFGLTSLIFGLILILNPIESTRAIFIIIGIYAIIYGIHNIVYATRYLDQQLNIDEP
jgi:uncharacterized membrane protein HdeD (DUF308 family)